MPSTFPYLLSSSPPQYRVIDEVTLLLRVCQDLPGDWTYNPEAIGDPDSVRFFQRTRVFTLQHFIRLLVARRRFSEALVGISAASSGDGLQSVLRQIIQCERVYVFTQDMVTNEMSAALGIVGTYYAIDARGRLGFFGAHAVRPNF